VARRTLNRSPRRTLARAVPIAFAALLVAAPAASAGLIMPESGGSPNANDISTLYKLILAMAIVIFLGVEGILIWSLFRFRARRGRVAAQIHGNTRLEIGWTIGAAVILVFLTVVTFIKLGSIKNPPASDIDARGNPVSGEVLFAQTDRPAPPRDSASMNIRVDGQQYVWRFQYPGPKQVFAYEEMVVPVGMTVTLDITSDDVAHSWWIPKLGGKFDAIPGYTNYTWFKIPGKLAGTVFTGQCAELCGRNHANMTATVRAVTPSEYERWLESRKADIKAADDAAAEQRKQIEQTTP
jgi:cytochrome c oxidase subunit II